MYSVYLCKSFVKSSFSHLLHLMLWNNLYKTVFRMCYSGTQNIFVQFYRIANFLLTHVIQYNIYFFFYGSQK